MFSFYFTLFYYCIFLNLENTDRRKIFRILNNYENFLLSAIQGDEYFLAGMCMVLSLAQGGPAPQFISPAIVRFLFGEALTLEEIIPFIEDQYKDHISEVHVL